jgi:hypothetical protein
MKTKTAFTLGAAAATAATLLGGVAIKRMNNKNIIDEIDARIPSPLIPNRLLTEEAVAEEGDGAPASEKPAGRSGAKNR